MSEELKAPENQSCSDCSGIVYRQTSSGKIMPVDQRCGAKITPTCYKPDGDGCAYQIYGDNNDEPIDRCKTCPLCYSDKVRHTEPENNPLTLDELREMDGEPVWIEQKGAPYPSAWGISTLLNWGEIDVVTLKGSFRGHDYKKTWLAYRQKPEARP